MFAIIQPSPLNSINPNLYFAMICTQLWKIYLSNCKKYFYKIIVSAFLKINSHMHHEFISRFSFWKFHWQRLISNWRKSSKPCGNSKPLITQCPYGHQWRTLTLFLYIDLRNVYMCESCFLKSFMFLQVQEGLPFVHIYIYTFWPQK